MSKPVIQFESVSKTYRQRRGRSLRDFFLQLGQNGKTSAHPPFMALKDVSFSIEPGETVGLIGPNGAGKSTALKLISGVSQASSGKVKVNGRVGALLELGAGFHPELSGRDNIYLNAALLGMSRREIQRKFDAIVDFSELEDFIDSPVKHYSSGMFMRLAFAVNIHVEPEILLVDEVLAVGDIDFQWKCTEKISELRKIGVTIILVTHSLDLLRDICKKTYWIDKGHIITAGNTDAVANQYKDFVLRQNDEQLKDLRHPRAQISQKRWGDRSVEILQVRLLNNKNSEQAIFETGQSFVIHIDYTTKAKVHSPIFGFAIFRQDGIQVCGPNTAFSDFALPDVNGAGSIEYRVSSLSLLEGVYHLSVAVADSSYTHTFDYHDEVCSFRVSNHINVVKERYGLVTLGGNWRLGTDGINR